MQLMPTSGICSPEKRLAKSIDRHDPVSGLERKSVVRRVWAGEPRTSQRPSVSLQACTQTRFYVFGIHFTTSSSSAPYSPLGQL